MRYKLSQIVDEYLSTNKELQGTTLIIDGFSSKLYGQSTYSFSLLSMLTYVRELKKELKK
jgi:hypothetical protein